MRVSVVKGEVGKTITAVYLAALLAEVAPVIRVDADPTSPSRHRGDR